LSEFNHITVLKPQVVDALSNAVGTIVDLTLGGGGHAEAILDALPDVCLIGFDRDPVAIEATGERLARHAGRVELFNAPFSGAPAILRDRGLSRDGGGQGIAGVVADLGVSSPQFDDPTRGFSLSAEGPLDMRMGAGQTAAEYLDEVTEQELARIFWEYGDIRASRRLARAVKNDRDAGLIETTSDLAGLCGRVLGRERKHDPATLPFQALRIAVNDELGELDTLLASLPDLLAEGGRAAIISFHSLEDRRVKRAFRALTKGPELPRGVPFIGDTSTDFRLVGKPVTANAAELAANPRARSARLRVLERRCIR
jgi:16S rRNA (cytosine1402-N4)-methyltransferase